MNRLSILIFLILLFLVANSLFSNIKNINKESKPLRETNELAFPLIDDNQKYIQKQTEVWYDKRKKGDPCYAVLEKDKIVMCKWMEMGKIKMPKIHYYSYHDQFTFEKLQKTVKNSGGKPLILKISHLQSNYGIILIPPNATFSELEVIYDKCLDKFKTCFVCNHDKSDPPTNKEIRDGKKTSYYKLYETIKPGVIIQDYFESYSIENKIDENGRNRNGGGKNIPIEYKILLFGDRVLNIGGGLLAQIDLYINREKYQPLFDEARKISKFLGATLIRVDFFVKKEDNPYIPYLNEISLSPNGGMNRATAYTNDELNKMKMEMNKSPHGDYSELNKLIKECPLRDSPIERYLTDAESVQEKY